MNSNRRQFSSSLLVSGTAVLPASAQSIGARSDTAAFRQAVLAGDLPAVTGYLDRDSALLYARDPHGNSVYTLASLAGQKEIAKQFESRGLVLDIFEASASGNVPRATELMKAVPGLVHLRSIDGRTPLHFATAAAHPAMVMFLNGQGADLSAGPESPMFAVAECQNLPASEGMAQILLGNASDPNAKRKDGNTLLHVAALKGNAAVTRLLVHRGADVNAKNLDGRTPLQVAIGDAVPLLRNEGGIERVYFGARYAQDLHAARVERDDTQGLPQHLINQFVTVAHSNADMVKSMLKKCPALLSTRATFDELAIEAAAHMGIVDLAQHLADLGSPVSACTAVMLGQLDLVRTMIQTDRGRLRERGAHDFPLLAYTAFGTDRAAIADLLLRAGVDVHAKAFTQTVLHLAAGKGHLELAGVLLSHGADINAHVKTPAGAITPAGVAVRQKQEKMVEFLMQRGGRV